jgi:hypothetical protein
MTDPDRMESDYKIEHLVNHFPSISARGLNCTCGYYFPDIGDSIDFRSWEISYVRPGASERGMTWSRGSRERVCPACIGAE